MCYNYRVSNELKCKKAFKVNRVNIEKVLVS